MSLALTSDWGSRPISWAFHGSARTCLLSKEATLGANAFVRLFLAF
jgi:hypothetical protein